jgi:hypothetical protein
VGLSGPSRTIIVEPVEQPQIEPAREEPIPEREPAPAPAEPVKEPVTV